MAAFQKVFYAIDKNNTGVITSTDLRNYMQKMKYKEDFVTTWTKLFDPEHTGIITYEKYCKVLGLKPEQRPPPSPHVPETGSSSHQTELQIKPTTSESVKTESIKQEPEKPKSANSDSVSKEDSDLNVPKTQSSSIIRNAKLSDSKEADQPKEGSGKQSRKRKHTDSSGKADLINPVISQSNCESHLTDNSGKERKPQPMDLTENSQAVESIISRKDGPILSGRASQKSKEEKSGKNSNNEEKNRNPKASEKAPKESPKEKSVPEDTIESGSGTDIFDFLIATKSNPVPTIDDFSDEEPSKFKNDAIAIDKTEPISASKSDSQSNTMVEKSPKTMDLEQESSKEAEKKMKEKPTKTTEKEPSDKKAEHTENSEMDVFDFLIATKEGPIETTDDFNDQPMDTIISGTAELTQAGNPTSLHESKRDKLNKKSRDGSRKASDKSEKKFSDANKDKSAANQGQQASGKDFSIEIIDDEDVKLTASLKSEKFSQSKPGSVKDVEKKRNPKASGKFNPTESGTEHPGERVRNISESDKRDKKPSELAAICTADQPVSIDTKHTRQTSESPKSNETIKHPPDSEKSGKKGKREKKSSESSRNLTEVTKVHESLDQLESTRKSMQEGRKTSKSSSGSVKESATQSEKNSPELSKVEMEIVPTITPVSLESVPPATGIPNPSSSEKISKDSSVSSVTHQNPKVVTKNKRQKKPPESKSDKPVEHMDAEMTAVQEFIVPAVESPVNQIPMEVETTPVSTEIQSFSKPPEPSSDMLEKKAGKNKLPDSDDKSDKKTTDSSRTGREELLMENTSHEQKKPSTDGKKSTDMESRRNKKSYESSPADIDPVPRIDKEIIPPVSASQESSLPPVEIDIAPTKRNVTDASLPSIDQKESIKKRGNKQSEMITSTAVSIQELSKGSEQSQEKVASESAKLGDMEVQHIKEESIKSAVSSVGEESAKKKAGMKKPLEASSVKSEKRDVLKSSDEHKDNKKDKPSTNSSESTKDSGKKSSTEHNPIEESITPLISDVQESASTDNQKKKSAKGDQNKSKRAKNQTPQKSADTAISSEFGHGISEQQDTSTMPPRNRKSSDSSSTKIKSDDKHKPSDDGKDGKKSKKSMKPSEYLMESATTLTNIQKSAEESIKQTKSVPQESAVLPTRIQKKSNKNDPVERQDQSKDSQEGASQNSKEDSKAIALKTDTTPPVKQPEAGKTGRKQNTKREEKKAKPIERTERKGITPPTKEYKDVGLEISSQPPGDSQLSTIKDSDESKKSTSKKRKAADVKDGNSSKRNKKEEGRNLKKKTEKEKKQSKKRKRPGPAEAEDGRGGEGIIKKSIKRPRIGNLECGRFPKSFAVQVPHRVAQHRRDGAPVSTHALGKAAKGFTTKMSVERRNRDQPNKSIQRWKLRKSLRKVGTVVILLAGRHKGKRAVVIGRHKFSGLLLITGPYKVNGIPIRRVHPDYVIATKTVIKMDKIRLPGRMQTREYFARQKPDNKLKNAADSLFVDSSADKKKPYVLKEERKVDQNLIDKRVISAIKQTKTAKILFAYLRSQFSLSRTDKPHKMVF